MRRSAWCLFVGGGGGDGGCVVVVVELLVSNRIIIDGDVDLAKSVFLS